MPFFHVSRCFEIDRPSGRNYLKRHAFTARRRGKRLVICSQRTIRRRVSLNSRYRNSMKRYTRYVSMDMIRSLEDVWRRICQGRGKAEVTRSERKRRHSFLETLFTGRFRSLHFSSVSFRFPRFNLGIFRNLLNSTRFASVCRFVSTRNRSNVYVRAYDRDFSLWRPVKLASVANKLTYTTNSDEIDKIDAK